MSLLEFLQYGLKYVYPQHPGSIVRGMPTAYSAPPFNKEIVKESIDTVVTLTELKKKLLKEFNDELEENKKIICESIFSSEIYSKYKDDIYKNFFIEYPINLIFINIKDGIYGFNITEPPIFNRVFIKSEDNNYCVIPVNNELPSKSLLDFIKQESKYMIPNILFEYVNTKDYHTEGSIGAGGNIHCLSKQIFKN
jgi:hypothetical protein